MNPDAYMLAWFMKRAPTCFCAGSPKMFVNERSLYECPECGHVVRLLAAGSRLKQLSEKDLTRLNPLPEQRPLPKVE